MFDYYSILLLSKVFNYRKFNCHLQIWNILEYYISLLQKKNIVKLIFKVISENTAWMQPQTLSLLFESVTSHYTK